MDLIILLGKPGSGKTSLGRSFVRDYRSRLITVGELLNREAEANSPRAERIRRRIAAGELVPTGMVREVIRDELLQTPEKLVLLDGFPRAIDQLEALSELRRQLKAQIGAYIVLDLDREEAFRRLIARRHCPNCGADYNLILDPPREDETCGRCGAGLVRRPDDHPETVKKRLERYRRKTGPVIRELEKNNPEAVFHISAARELPLMKEELAGFLKARELTLKKKTPKEAVRDE